MGKHVSLIIYLQPEGHIKILLPGESIQPCEAT